MRGSARARVGARKSPVAARVVPPRLRHSQNPQVFTASGRGASSAPSAASSATMRLVSGSKLYLCAMRSSAYETCGRETSACLHACLRVLQGAGHRAHSPSPAYRRTSCTTELACNPQGIGNIKRKGSAHVSRWGRFFPRCVGVGVGTDVGVGV